MPLLQRIDPARIDWQDRYQQVRAASERICQPLQTDDYQIQSIVETSPPKWHLAHVSWFFETFILNEFLSGYRPFHPQFHYLFNSYYETVGSMHPRPKRGLLSRPTVNQVYAYRAYVDEHMLTLLDQLPEQDAAEILRRVELGLHHEQQHQELLLMDIKHNLFVNPLYPVYRHDLNSADTTTRPLQWQALPGGVQRIGSDGETFAFDNETPRHQTLINECRLADRLITNDEYRVFIKEGGYRDPALWLADGWYLINQQHWQHPLYWVQQDDAWFEFTLAGLKPLNPDAPVSHVSYYEADAFARWAGKRLPSEAELEVMLAEQPVSGNFVDDDMLHPQPADSAAQWYGDCWNWTASPYGAYPKFKPLAGSMGEYNGKFMSNQMVLKGGCCFTPADHIRASYRNFFYPHDRWACSGIRLAEDV